MVVFRVASLFAGIGGTCLGFQQAGATVVWASELDSAACATYRANFGTGYLVEGDVAIMDSASIPEFDILTAGFPCQPFSVAGQRLGFGDARGALFFDFLRILRERRPQAFLLENVKNLMTIDRGRTFDVILVALDDAGYHFQFQILNTQHHGNLPQSRDRLYMVGFRNPRANRTFQFPGPMPLTRRLDDVIDRHTQRADAYCYRESSQYFPLLKMEVRRRDRVYQLRRIYVRESSGPICPTLTANMGGGGHNVPLIVDDFGVRKLTEREALALQGFPSDFKIPEKTARSHVYRQAGNTVSVPVVRRIARRMITVLASI